MKKNIEHTSDAVVALPPSGPLTITGDGTYIETSYCEETNTVEIGLTKEFKELLDPLLKDFSLRYTGSKDSLLNAFDESVKIVLTKTMLNEK